MKALIAVCILSLVSASCRESPTSIGDDATTPRRPAFSAAQPQTFKLVIPIQFDAWACVETVSLNGEILAVYHSNDTDQGNHDKVLFLQRLTGYGQLTGYNYQAIGNLPAVGMVADDGADPSTEVFTFMLVSRTAQLHVRLLMHTTVNANGDLTASVLESSVECKAH